MPEPDRHPIDDLWRAPLVASVILAGQALALLLALAPGVAADRLVYFGLASLLIQWVALGTLGFLYLLRRWLNPERPLAVAGVALLLAPAVAAAAGAVAWRFAPWGSSQAVALLQLASLALLVGLITLVALHNHHRARAFAALAQQYEIETLRTRIQPHFLFNTLNTAAALVRQSPAEAERLLLDLADVFRAALKSTGSSTLAEEIDLVRHYLAIEQRRLGARLQLEWELPDALPALAVPRLCLQPLVENAIRHGIEPRVEGGTVCIRVLPKTDAVDVLILNDVPPPTARARPGHLVGVGTTRMRLQHFFRGQASLYTGLAGGRYCAHARLPLAQPSDSTR